MRAIATSLLLPPHVSARLVANPWAFREPLTFKLARLVSEAGRN